MTLSTCRQCGHEGYEEADDPVPGLCPVCLAARMAAAFPDGEIPYTTDPAKRARIRKICLEIGFTEAYLALTDGLGAEAALHDG